MSFDRITHAAGKPCVRDTGITVASILGRMLGGRTRVELLADHPGLVSADIDQAFDFTKHQLRGGELPDVEFGGKYLSPAELSAVRCPEEAGERLETLIRREKTTGVTTEERAEIEDCLRLDHLFIMAKARAKARLLATAG